jgi:hypothetical protein
MGGKRAPKTRKATKPGFDSLISDGGDDRIRTCEGLLTLNDLANRRFQPLSHVSVDFHAQPPAKMRASGRGFILA